MRVSDKINAAKARKLALRTILFYVILFILIWILPKISSRDPSSTGPGISLFFFTPVISVLLLFVTAVMYTEGQKIQKVPMLIHFLALFLFFLILTLVNFV